MANQTGRPIAPARKLVAAVIGTIAVFVIVYGLGLASWPVAIFGLVMLAIAIALTMVGNVRRGGRATVAGNAEVVDISAPPISGAYGRAEIRAIVVAPGLGTSEAVIRDGRVPVAKWPTIGSTVPITVDVDDTRRVRVNWKDAPARDEGADPPQQVQPDLGEDPDDADDAGLSAVAPGPWEGRDNDFVTEPTSTPVVVRDTPDGPILEGQLVGTGEQATPLPRRAANGPRSGFDTAATDPVGFDPLDPDPADPRATSPVSPGAPGSPVSPGAPGPTGSPAAASEPAPSTDQVRNADADAPVSPARGHSSAESGADSRDRPSNGTATSRPGSGASSQAWPSASYPPPPATAGPAAGDDYPPPPGPSVPTLGDDYPPPPG
ncbi:hypothetical protein ADL15_01225, partial [Actinoplanes awajinensis subsp. mycoplanecinus]